MQTHRGLIRALSSCVPRHVQLFATPRIVVHLALQSMGYPRQEHWNGLPFPSPGNLPDPRIELTSVSCVSCICRKILHHRATWQALLIRALSPTQSRGSRVDRRVCRACEHLPGSHGRTRPLLFCAPYRIPEDDLPCLKSDVQRIPLHFHRCLLDGLEF